MKKKEITFEQKMKQLDQLKAHIKEWKDELKKKDIKVQDNTLEDKLVDELKVTLLENKNLKWARDVVMSDDVTKEVAKKLEIAMDALRRFYIKCEATSHLDGQEVYDLASMCSQTLNKIRTTEDDA